MIEPQAHREKSELIEVQGVKGTAVFCRDGCHRYRLDRRLDGPYRWPYYSDPSLLNLNFILLNPSTGTADEDDPTIGRCIRFARDWGYETITITNIFAMRSTDAAQLRAFDNNLVVSPELNDEIILDIARDANQVIAGWGTHGVVRGRGGIVFKELQRVGIDVNALAVTKEGFPGHPLYLLASAVGERYHGRIGG